MVAKPGQAKPDLTIREAVRETGLSLSTVRRLADRGVVEARRGGGQGRPLLFDSAAMEALHEYAREHEPSLPKVPRENGVTVNQLAERAGLTRETILRHVRLGHITPVGVAEDDGRTYIFSKEAAEQFATRARYSDRTKNIGPCRWQDCDRQAQAQGFCVGHYAAVKTTREHEHLIPPEKRAARCLAPECDDPQYAQGLCRNHHAQALRGGGDCILAGLEIPPLEHPTADAVRLKRILSGYTLEDVGDRLGVTRERVRQIEKALPRMLETGRGLEAHSLQSYGEVVGVDFGALVPVRPASLVRRGVECPCCAGAGRLERVGKEAWA